MHEGENKAVRCRSIKKALTLLLLVKNTVVGENRLFFLEENIAKELNKL